MASPFRSFDPPTVYFALAELPLAETVATAVEVRLTTLFITNSSAVDGTITIQNSAGRYLAKDMAVPANTPLPALEFPYLYMRGVKLTPSVSGIYAQVEGYDDI